ncbi:hypothetical protein ACLIA0_04695 [Bacillaceae bacterium W0354]
MNRNQAIGSVIPGGLILGMGVGMLFDKTSAGLFIGLGLGMLLYGFLGAVFKVK